MYQNKNEHDQNDVTMARCGMNCTECRFALENDCPGCMQGKVFEDEECEILECCAKKDCEHCGKCREFPCDMLKAVSYHTETGDGGARLIRLKEISDNENRRQRGTLIPLLSGLCTGISAGAVIGGIAGAFLPWIIAGAVSGAGIGYIIGLGKQKG